jgi:hypothetical protein
VRIFLQMWKWKIKFLGLILNFFFYQFACFQNNFILK